MVINILVDDWNIGLMMMNRDKLGKSETIRRVEDKE